MNRVCVFIDGSNLFHALKRSNTPTRMDYYQFSKALADQAKDRSLVRIYYFNGAFDPAAFPDKASAQKEFFDSLDRTPYLDLRLGRIISNRNGERMEKGVDVRMATDMVYYAARDFYDTAIVVTEDQDFVPAINSVKELGKQVEVVLSRDAANRDMIRSADRVIWFDDFLKVHKNTNMFPEDPGKGKVPHATPVPTSEVLPPSDDAEEDEGSRSKRAPDDNIGNRV